MRTDVETRPFFLTTEFAVVVAALAALAATAGMSDELDAGLAWLLATGIVVAYAFGRGFAKAASPSHVWDPRETLLQRLGNETENDDDERQADEEETREMSTTQREDYGTRSGGGPTYGYGAYGYGRGFGMRQMFPIETKPFFLTSEFWGSVAAIVGLAIGAGTSDSVDARLFWILTTAITIGYVISRGIAKSGTKSRSWDPREDLMERMRGDGGRDRVGAAD